jgi:hypothetical protein
MNPGGVTAAADVCLVAFVGAPAVAARFAPSTNFLSHVVYLACAVMLQQRAFTLVGAVAAAGQQQQQMLPCWLAGLKCITEALHSAVSQPALQQCTQQQQSAPAARPPGVLQLPVQHASREGTQQQIQLQLHASAAMQHVQWPSLNWPTWGCTGTAVLWCGSAKHQASLWNSNSSSSSSYHAAAQPRRGMHSAAADPEGQQLLAKPSPAGGSSSSSSTDGANATQQQQQVATTFEDMGLPDTLLKALLAQGFAAPTPVQVAAQQAVLSGRNVALQSATGTGKVSNMCADVAVAAAAAGDCGVNVDASGM